ncbi:MAG: hypothetical protein SGPRY_005089 [Prymnesium sp.]
MMSLVPPLLVAALAPQPGVVRGCLSDGRAHRSALHLALPFDPPSPRAMRPTRLHPHERRPLLTRTRPLTSLAPRLWRGLITLGTVFAIQRPLAALAHGAMISGAPSKPLSQSAMISRFVVWFVMFATAALLAGAETAITTLWPWKVKQLATDEGPTSPFSVLQNDITRVLTTVLVGITFCTIFGTALATDMALQLFGQTRGSRRRALAMRRWQVRALEPRQGKQPHLRVPLTAQPERLARATLPFIAAVTVVLAPVTYITSAFSNGLLRALGNAGEGEGLRITNSELRMILGGAGQSGAVELYEQDMIEGVLDLQRSQVQQIMTPRVELVAIKAESSLVELLELAREYKYSRVPVYNQSVDEINGVVLSRELLEFTDSADLEHLKVSSIMEEVEFVPESMTVMNALKQMRLNRLHMMVVVDEFGGTSGVITLEDILETFVGEIYDENDKSEAIEATGAVAEQEDGSFLIDGMADLQPTCERLQLEVPEETLAEFSTLSGFLCHVAGEIPKQDDVVLFDGLRFDVLEADERRLLLVRASNMTIAEGERLHDLQTPPV